MSDLISFTAIKYDYPPLDIALILQEFMEIQTIFGTKCYVWIRDDEKDPIILLDDEQSERFWIWYDAHEDRPDVVFNYHWS